MRRLGDCITRIRDWMASDHLKLNEDKTQVIWLGTRQQLNTVTTQVLTLPNATVQFSDVVNDLDVTNAVTTAPNRHHKDPPVHIFKT